MRWIDALREWNTGSGKWCIPKKGTEAYDAVRALMGEKEPKAKAPKAEKAPKEAKAPKASLQDMAAAVGVPMKQMKASAADYYKRVDNADPESRALLMERMPAQLRAGWEKHLASKAPKDAPAVRRVLKKKPVMVAVPEAPPAPAPAMKIPMERQRKAFSDSMVPKIAMKPTSYVYWKRTDAQKAVDRAGLSQKERKERDDWIADREKRTEDRKKSAMGNLLNYWRDMGEGREKKHSTFRKGVIEDVDVALAYYPRSSIPEYAMKVYLRSEEGKRYLAQEEKKQASKEPAAPAVRRVIKKPVMVAAKPEAPPAPTVQSELRAYYAKMSGAERAQYAIAKQRRNKKAIAYYEKTYPFLKEEAK